MSQPPRTEPQRVPVRTILATIALVLVTVAAIEMLRALHKILAWVAVAVFVAVVLGPAVDFLEQRARVRRTVSTLLVFLVGVGLFVAMMYAFIRPIVDQVQKFADDFPAYVEEAKAGEGPVGDLVQRYDVDRWIEENQDRLDDLARQATTPALSVLRSAASALAAILTVLVLAFLMLIEGPALVRGITTVMPEAHRERIRRVAADSAKAITGYMAGNLLISVIAGIATYVFLLVAGVPFKEVLALWVAFADLIPLVGATLGAVVVIAVAFLHSTVAGIATIVFFIVYQQFENHVLQVTIMSRTVDLNPLAVLVAVLAGVELFGILGALFAIPIAGVVQVVVRDLYDERMGRLKEVPTVGTDEVPISDAGGRRG